MKQAQNNENGSSNMHNNNYTEENENEEIMPLIDEEKIMKIKEKLLNFDDFNYSSITHDL